MKTALVFGAGQIGRGFIGDICHESGYALVFVDADREIVRLLNERREYPIWILGEGKSEKNITGVRALHISDRDKICAEIAGASVAFTAVGAKNLSSLGALLAEGIQKRYESRKGEPLNVVICENLLGASQVLREAVLEKIAAEFAPVVSESIGFVETVVSRMVAPVPEDLRGKYPLLATVEPYNVLPVARKHFKGRVPEVKGFYPVDKLVPYEELKLFMHNLAHACLAYAGYIRKHRYIWEAMDDAYVYNMLEKVAAETKAALIKKHGFDIHEIEMYVSDLFCRFRNRLLNDTVKRVGRDPMRKIEAGDRIAGAIELCLSQGIFPHGACFVMAACLCYNDKSDENALEMQKLLRNRGIKFIIKEIAGISDKKAVDRITTLYSSLKESTKNQNRRNAP